MSALSHALAHHPLHLLSTLPFAMAAPAASSSSHAAASMAPLPAPPTSGFLAISNAPPIYASVEALRAASNFGDFGGRYIPETLVAAHEEMERIYVECSQDPAFRAELEQLGRDYIGRPTPLYHAKRLSEAAGGAQIWLKREELAFTGSHK